MRQVPNQVKSDLIFNERLTDFSVDICTLFIILRDTIFTTFFLLRYKHLFSFKCKAVMLYAGFWYSAVYQFGVIVLVVNLA